MKRPSFSNLRYILAAGVATALIVGGIVMLAPEERKATGAPNIDALKKVLERSAEEALPPPTVAGDEIALEIPVAEREAASARIFAIATDLGGTALPSESADGAQEVLAQIPAGRVAAFRARVTGRDTFKDPDTEPGDTRNELVVVKFTSVAPDEKPAVPSASPAPSAPR